MKLLIVSETSEGGIADYAHDQAVALAGRGIDVTMLCSQNFIDKRNVSYRALPVLRELRAGGLSKSRAVRRVKLAFGVLHNMRVLARHIAADHEIDVLTHFSEYLAPLWAPRWLSLRARGARFHSVLHDPVRNYQVGPRVWHEWSVRVAFRPLSNVFVHTTEPVPVPESIPVTVIPYGVHNYPPPRRSRNDVRASLGIPRDASLLVSYGYIRDNKNLDLVIEALIGQPECHLLVAGPEQGGGGRSISYYRELALRFGVADRCYWDTRYLSADDTADILSASDLSVLTYARTFVSSSAALGVSARYHLPSLISSGSAATEAMVRAYRLGVWVEPDSMEAIAAGLREWMMQDVVPDWEAFFRDYSWERNAEIVARSMQRTLPQEAPEGIRDNLDKGRGSPRRVRRATP